ncbi:hypothetical protein GN277_01350 [Lachnospiraceae bacterium WCA-9-b2]|uniref:Uncharacterized protein n=1 Tax=Sporofaciens musculi TaxID=2681861 RepID=A0A7X3MCX8_9FIRM|nr:hypothetical protein [Sporofaciens musculi]MXP74129.1 hypothetical protein [Sporofaciens musculi]
MRERTAFKTTLSTNCRQDEERYYRRPPVFLEVRHSKSDWKLVEYPRKEILKELSEGMKTEKNENETKSKTTI